MKPFWIDTSVLVQSRQKYHTRERVPQFWTWLSAQVETGAVLMPHNAWTELCKGNDWLAEWCKRRSDSGLNSMPDQAIQQMYGKCADEVKKKWARVPHQWSRTLDGGDLWVIAHAKCTGGVAVSEENKALRNETDRVVGQFAY